MDGKTILIVDDAEVCAYFLKMVLEKEGYTVFYAVEEKEAREKVRDIPFDLLVADIGFHGDIECSRILDYMKHEKPKVPVVLWSNKYEYERVENKLWHRGFCEKSDLEGSLITIKNIIETP